MFLVSFSKTQRDFLESNRIEFYIYYFSRDLILKVAEMSRRRIIRKVKNTDAVKCYKCDKTFSAERYLVIHQEKIPDCDKELKCNKCKKIFKTHSHLNSHLNRKTPCAPEEVPVIKGDNEENRCKYCSGTYCNRQSLKRHYKTCSAKDNPTSLIELVKSQNNKIDQLTKTVEQLQNGNIIVNQTYNDNRVTNNIIMIGFGNEDLKRIVGTELAAQFLLDHKAEGVVPKLVEYLHCNPENPELQNVYMSHDDDEVAVVFGRSDTKDELTWIYEKAEIVSKQLIDNVNGIYLTGGFPSEEILELENAELDRSTIQIMKDSKNKKAIDENIEKVNDVLKAARTLHPKDE